MYIGWKFFLPITLSFIFFFTGILFSTQSLYISQLIHINEAFDFINSFSIRF
jgi:hypothetical protein